MDLLFKREQKTNNHQKTNFVLWAKIEPDSEENALINKYKMKDAMLIEAVQPKLIRNSILISVVMAIVAVVPVNIFAISERMYSPMMVFGAAILIGIACGYIYYTQKRETIYVKDLLHGRKFKCKSVIELARKEAFLESITNYFRQVVESAKHWDGQETRPISPMPPEEAKRFILSGPLL